MAPEELTGQAANGNANVICSGHHGSNTDRYTAFSPYVYSRDTLTTHQSMFSAWEHTAVHCCETVGWLSLKERFQKPGSKSGMAAGKRSTASCPRRDRSSFACAANHPCVSPLWEPRDPPTSSSRQTASLSGHTHHPAQVAAASFLCLIKNIVSSDLLCLLQELSFYFQQLR